MRRPIYIFLLSLALSATGRAEHPDLFDRLIQIHQVNVVTKECQQEWQGYMSESTTIKIKVDDYTNLYFLPCAQWSRNLSWNVYAEFKEDQGDGHGLVRPVLFSSVDYESNLVGESIVYNWMWNPDTNELFTRYFLSGKPDCGRVMMYQWDNSLLRFSLKRAWMKNVCDGNLNWPEVSLPSSISE